MIPKSAGTIVPNDQMGSGGNTVNFNITSWDSQDTIAAIDKNKRQITEMLFGTANTYNLGRV